MLGRIGIKSALIVAMGVFGGLAFGQVSQGVTLKSQIGLATFGAGSGNDCWGYVSESGREYAIMGMNNQVAFVDVTNPSNPVIIESIPHGSSTWGDIKVYQGVAYAVTERSGTGIQVINMRDIDNGNVVLERTLTSPSRAHNVVMDAENGFLYAVGARGGTGTTMCFDLSDPLNPVQVGASSISLNYLHDAQVVTYDSGPLSGKQVMFGFSEGRGVDVYDVTDKNNPSLLKRIVYPDMRYCHQGWLSEDRRFLYVDDELDEDGLQVPTRSLIFNVEDPENAFYVGTFSTGLEAIDHNQYVVDGFSFQANYRSGLRIFDVWTNPTAPQQVGFYDTFPSSDSRGFDGAWSCYPFFPSGNVIISDIQGGLFVVDASEALTRRRKSDDFTLVRGLVLGGNLGSLAAEDDNVMWIRELTGPDELGFTGILETFATTHDGKPDRIQVDVVSRGLALGYRQVIEVYNFKLERWETRVSRALLNTKSRESFTITGNTQDYVQPGANIVKVRTKWRPDARRIARLQVHVDSIEFKFLR